MSRHKTGKTKRARAKAAQRAAYRARKKARSKQAVDISVEGHTLPLDHLRERGVGTPEDAM